MSERLASGRLETYRERLDDLLLDLARVREVGSAPGLTTAGRIVELLTVIAEQMLEANHTLETLYGELQTSRVLPRGTPAAQGWMHRLRQRLPGRRVG